MKNNLKFITRKSFVCLFESTRRHLELNVIRLTLTTKSNQIPRVAMPGKPRAINDKHSDNKRGLSRKRHIVIETDDRDSLGWRPSDWESQWSNLLTMRESYDAPVDVMGCERLADERAAPQTFRYQVLLSLMLSSQTKDEITAAAMEKLKKHGCNVDNNLNTEPQTLENLIYPVGFYKRKTQHILKTTQILKDKYSGDIPKTVEELCELPGVGPKMAHLTMKCAWNEVTGIGVDTHVHKISNRLGWTRNVTKTPIQTQKEIEKWIPRDLWHQVNYIMVGFGQQICHTDKPKCDSCLNKSTCLYNLGIRK